MKTELGIEENIEGALCYAFFWVTGIVFLLIEPKNKFVRFHAMQSIVVFLPLWLLSFIFGGFFGFGYFWGPGLYFLAWFGWLLWILTIILWIVLMLKAYMKEKFKLPIAGDIAENLLKKNI